MDLMRAIWGGVVESNTSWSERRREQRTVKTGSMTSLWRSFDVKENRKMKHSWSRMWGKGKFSNLGSKKSSKKEELMIQGEKEGNFRTKPGFQVLCPEKDLTVASSSVMFP